MPCFIELIASTKPMDSKCRARALQSLAILKCFSSRLRFFGKSTESIEYLRMSLMLKPLAPRQDKHENEQGQ